MAGLMLAQTTLTKRQMFQFMHERFAEPEPNTGRQVLLVLLLMATLLGLLYLILHIQRRHARPCKPQPISLYLRVLRRLGLPLRERWHLWRLAKVMSIEHPAALLISPQIFDETVRGYCSGHGWLGGRAGLAPQFASIRHRLFGPEGQ